MTIFNGSSLIQHSFARNDQGREPQYEFQMYKTPMNKPDL